MKTIDLGRSGLRSSALAYGCWRLAGTWNPAEVTADIEAAGQRAGQRNPTHPAWVGYQLGKLLEPDTIILDDALSNSEHVTNYHRRSLPGTYFKSGGSSGG